MAARRKSELVFTPTLQLISQQRSDSPYTAFSGSNNTGKSVTLRSLKGAIGRTAYYVGSNRFYHVHQFSTGLREQNEIDQLEHQFQSQWQNEAFNYEQNVFDLNRIIVGLVDKRRDALFSLCGQLLGCTMSMKKVVEENELSPRYVEIDGQNIAQGSSGTRLLLTLLGLCMDERFSTVLVDEPELGLTPRIQTALAAFLQDPTERKRYFPHLQRVFVATHSQIFLGRRDITDNFVVSRHGPAITLKRIQTISEFHGLQFNMLGNDLETLHFPSAIMIVEGKSDLDYLRRVVEVHFPGRRVTVVSANGDPKAKVHGLRETLGDLSMSPFRDRLFVVVDQVHAHGLRLDLEKIGLLPNHFVCWSRNGIEYLYPRELMSQIFGSEDLAGLILEGDRVSMNGITKTKAELATEMVRRLLPRTKIPAEVEEKLLAPIRNAIGVAPLVHVPITEPELGTKTA